MSKICVTTNISIHIFISTCKQVTQSEPTEFSKNGGFHSKVVVIFFSNYPKPSHSIHTYRTGFKKKGIILHHFTPFYTITAENISKSN